MLTVSGHRRCARRHTNTRCTSSDATRQQPATLAAMIAWALSAPPDSYVSELSLLPSPGPIVSAKSGSTVIWYRVGHICPVDDLIDLTYPQPFATGPAWTSIGLAGSR